MLVVNCGKAVAMRVAYHRSHPNRLFLKIFIFCVSLQWTVFGVRGRLGPTAAIRVAAAHRAAADAKPRRPNTEETHAPGKAPRTSLATRSRALTVSTSTTGDRFTCVLLAGLQSFSHRKAPG